MITKLLPCPFCGSEAQHSEESRFHIYWVYCPGCGAASGYRSTEAEAIDAWNTRAERTCKNAVTEGYSFRFGCSECGYSTIVHNCTVRLDELPSYCPNCGAKVIGGNK